ncbi:roadblock/LC7 domain-containing protein [candidate division KSB1 bacterium]|nr:roadblock/LC7 domain-containing protein [bacterium]RKY76044.1 MAG: roadblock/LC7 domain-containing protein [candidate division KSB1 bacterium]RKY89611.1 MAG: roadblock/LC7 domain-containing protein [candidate division KSB1 bacterium]
MRTPDPLTKHKQSLLSEEQYYQISNELDLLKGKLKATLLVFGDMNGQLITHKGEIPGIDITVLAALIASDFSATTEIAKLLGKENQFRLHFHEGTQQHLYISSVGEEFFLAVVFDSSVTLGMVRIFTAKSITKITRLIETSVEKAVQASNIVDAEFKTFIEEDLNKILG